MAFKWDVGVIDMTAAVEMFIGEYARSRQTTDKKPRFGHGGENLMAAAHIRKNFVASLKSFADREEDEWQRCFNQVRARLAEGNSQIDKVEVETLMLEVQSLARGNKAAYDSAYTKGAQTTPHPLRPEVSNGSVIDPKIVYG